ncbi:MAG: hypothetical protein H7Z42_16965, partial [Roseiflexaceae bacterium]|nr:hypothetical protein [Roseiflexaceae bacterium]
MVEAEAPRGVIHPMVERRWVGVIYALFAGGLLVLAALQHIAVMQAPAAWLLAGLLGATALTAWLIGRGRWVRLPTLLLLALDAVTALLLIMVTGGYASPMWIGLLVVSTAAPLLLPGRWAGVLLVLVWLAYGGLLLLVPLEQLPEAAASWVLRCGGVALVAIVLYRALSSEEQLRQRAEHREQVLHTFLNLSARLRASNDPQSILEETARTVQASGSYTCVTLSMVDQTTGIAAVKVAIGASGRRLAAVEGLEFPWRVLDAQLTVQRTAAPGAYLLDLLPFRSIGGELHVVLP